MEYVFIKGGIAEFKNTCMLEEERMSLLIMWICSYKVILSF